MLCRTLQSCRMKMPACPGIHDRQPAMVYHVLQSLRQVLKGLHALADADNLSKPASNNPISRLFSSAPLCSPNTSSSLPCSSPVLRSDSELTRSSPMRHVAHFWGPGLSPRAFPDTDLPLSNDSHSQPAATSILARLHQCCSRQRNLSSQGPIKKDAGSSNSGGSSKLWSFNTDLTEDVLTSMFYKRLCWQMGLGVAMESLIAEALQASSTGGIHAACNTQHCSESPSRTMAMLCLPVTAACCLLTAAAAALKWQICEVAN